MLFYLFQKSYLLIIAELFSRNLIRIELRKAARKLRSILHTNQQHQIFYGLKQKPYSIDKSMMNFDCSWNLMPCSGKYQECYNLNRILVPLKSRENGCKSSELKIFYHDEIYVYTNSSEIYDVVLLVCHSFKKFGQEMCWVLHVVKRTTYKF